MNTIVVEFNKSADRRVRIESNEYKGHIRIGIVEYERNGDGMWTVKAEVWVNRYQFAIVRQALEEAAVQMDEQQ